MASTCARRLVGTALAAGLCCGVVSCRQEPRLGDASAPAAAPAGTGLHRNDREVAALPQPLDMRQAVARALAGNPDMQVTAARLHRAEARLRLARAAYQPRLGLEFAYLRADQPSTSLFKTIDQHDLAPQVDFNDPGQLENFGTVVSLQYNLYNGGRDHLAEAQAEVGTGLARVGRAATRNDLVAGVMTAWYEVRAASAAVRAAAVAVATVRARLDETRTVFELGGRALKDDLLALEARLAEADEQAIRARNGRLLAAMALLDLLGETDDGPEVLELGEEQTVEVAPDRVSALAEALRLRPELQAAALGIAQAELGRDLAAAAWRPRVDLVGSLSWDDEALDYRSDETNWSAALRLSWQLYDGGARRHRSAAAWAGLREARAVDRRALLELRSDIRRSYLAMDDARARRETTQTGLAAAEQALQLVQARFRAGAARVTRYLEAEQMADRARLRHIQAEHDLAKARVQAARASGRFLEGQQW